MIKVDKQGESGPLLILLPGWAASSQIFSNFEVWAQAYRMRIWRVDYSAAEFDALYQKHPVALQACVEAILAEVQEPAIWVGWSLGGLIALKAAALQPQRTQALFMLAATPQFVAGEDWPHAMSEEMFNAFEQDLIAQPAQLLKRFRHLQVKGSVAARTLIPLLEEKASDASVEQLQQQLNWLRQSAWAEWERLKDRVFFVLGGKDLLVPSLPWYGAMREHFTPFDAQLSLFPDAAHLPFLSDAEAFFTDLEKRLALHGLEKISDSDPQQEF